VVKLVASHADVLGFGQLKAFQFALGFTLITFQIMNGFSKPCDSLKAKNHLNGEK